MKTVSDWREYFAELTDRELVMAHWRWGEASEGASHEMLAAYVAVNEECFERQVLPHSELEA